jgi:hypothetical protein
MEGYMKHTVSMSLVAVLLALIGCGPDNHAPEKASALYPAAGATAVFVDIGLYWTASDEDGDAIEYAVYFGTSASPPRIRDYRSDTWLDPDILLYDTVYYWRVDVRDEHGAITEGETWHFETMDATTNYQQYYLATGTYCSIDGNYHDPDPERGAPWIALSSYGSEGAGANWEFFDYNKTAIETLTIGAYSYDNGWDITGGEHYQLFNHETQGWDLLFDSDKQQDWHYAELTGTAAKPYVDTTANQVLLRLLTGYTDNSHIREVFCKQADLDTAIAERAPGTIKIIGGMKTHGAARSELE